MSVMTAEEALSPNPAIPNTSFNPEAIRAYVKSDLVPQVKKIDLEGAYPEDVMRGLGDFGAYDRHLSKANGLNKMDALAAVQAMAIVGETCLSTAFCMWCHDACGWYLENTENEALRQRYITDVGSALQLGGTGLSNPMKHLSGIEPMKLQGEPVDGGFIVNGNLPWISNLGDNHLFGAVFQLKDDPEHKVMALIRCDDENVMLHGDFKTMSMDGTRTFAVRFKDAFVPSENVLADPAPPFMKKIRPGFIFLQMGMGLGIIRGCADLMVKQRAKLGHVNQYLPDQPEYFFDKADELEATLKRLAPDLTSGDEDYFREILVARIAGSDLSLKAAESAMLHCGARGFIDTAEANRRVRESYFVALVTPATKHLRKELARLDGELLD